MSGQDFENLIARVRRGEHDAAAELMQTYGPQIRRIARIRLTDQRLRRVLDSADICQSVMACFFQRAAAGQFELEAPDQLLRLLATMVRNRIINAGRYHAADRRALRRTNGDDACLNEVRASGSTPSVIVAREELLQKFRDLLNDDERRMFELRSHGHAWADIAAEFGIEPDAVRKRLSRASARIASELRPHDPVSHSG